MSMKPEVFLLRWKTIPFQIQGQLIISGNTSGEVEKIPILDDALVH